jgi:hypothetical protein
MIVPTSDKTGFGNYERILHRHRVRLRRYVSWCEIAESLTYNSRAPNWIRQASNKIP